MKVAVIGAGAMGCLVAALLSKTKEEIWLLDKNRERAAKINNLGISVEGVSGNWKANPKVTADISSVGAADLILICVKAYHTKEVMTQIKPLLNRNTSVLTLQNGIGNIEVIAESLAIENIMGGVTSEGATLLNVGHIRHAGRGETIIGRLDGKMPVEMRKIRELFSKASFEIKFSRDIKSLLWSKLIINVGINALTAITRLPNGKLLDFDGTRKIMREAVTEAVKVAKRKRIKLLYDDPLAKVEAVCETTSANISSMLQDVLRKKRTEIDFINGVILRQAQELGIAVYANTLLVELVKTIEASYAYSCV